MLNLKNTITLLLVLFGLCFLSSAKAVEYEFGGDVYKHNPFLKDWDISRSTDDSVGFNSDVSTAGVVNGQALLWISSNSRFEPGNVVVSVSTELASGSTDYIQNRNTLQSGSSFYVELGSGTEMRTMNLYVSENIGVGTLNPGAPLHVKYNSGSPQIRMNRSDGSGVGYAYFDGNNFFNLQNDSGGRGFIFKANTTVGNNGIQFVDLVDNATWFHSNRTKTIISTGSVGIGTTAPSRELDIERVVGSSYLTISDGSGAGSERLLMGYTEGETYNGNVIDNANPVQIFADTTGNLHLSPRTNNASGVILYSNSGTDGEERMRIASSGNVGIGTTGPAQKLHISGSLPTPLKLERDSNANVNIIYENTTGPMYAGIDDFSGNFWGVSVNQDLSAVPFFTVRANGNVGIGTLPSNAFQVGTSSLVVNGFTGNVGIGTSGATSKLDVIGATVSLTNHFSGIPNEPNFVAQKARGSLGSETAVLIADVVGGITFKGHDGAKYVEAAKIAAYVGATPSTNDMPGDLVFLTTPDGSSVATEKMRLRNSGNLGIGIQGAGERLEVFGGNIRLTGSGATNTGMVFNDSGGDSDFWIGRIDTDSNLGTDNDRFDIGNGLTPGTSAYVSITNTGNVGIGTTNPRHFLHVESSDAFKLTNNVWSIASDIRTKKSTESFADGLDVLAQIKPIRYVHNGLAGTIDGMGGIGISAQEVEAVAPYMIERKHRVFSASDTLRGFEVEEVPGGFRTSVYEYNGSALPFITVNAVKELQQQLIDLKAAFCEVAPLSPLCE